MKKLVIFILISITAIMLLAETPYQTVSTAGVTLNYRVTDDSQNLECQLSANTTGWVAVGFDPTNTMQNGNIIIGYDQAGTTMIRDDWGTTQTAHSADTAIGGTNDIITSSSMETGGVTELHFIIPLDSGDTKDKPLMIGQSYPIILARGANGADNFTGMHAGAGFANITIAEPVSIDDNTTQFLKPLMITNYPNPFNPETTIKFAVNSNEQASLEIFNIIGQSVKSFGSFGNGNHEIVWNGFDNSNSAVSGGIYFARIKSGSEVATRKLTLLK
ncbi:MAG: T9SS type A sorting domain-containing protein [Candidatus Cloacimonetes bacterium]|nr:T9SS type A sorting domain-containing protein [Candidatus Cloacimonadota bacterium]